MYYVNCYTFLEEPYFWEKQTRSPVLKDFGQGIYALWSFSGQQ